MSHMLADSEDELHRMAQSIGLKREWFQSHGTPHYDVCQAKRKQAVVSGAIEVGRRDLVALIRRLRAKGNKPTRSGTVSDDDRLFIGVFPGGISYADRHREAHGDYAKLAFLPYDSLELKIEDDCPAELRAEIERDAASIQAKRGEQYRISACGQTVTLGGDCPPPAQRMKP